MPQPSRLFALLPAVIAVAAVSAAAFRVGGHHGPPWNAPAAATHLLHVRDATVQVDIAPGALDLSTPEVLQWVGNAATAVATYYGRLPVSRDRILVEIRPGDSGVMHGTTWGDVGGFPAFTRIVLGQHTTVQQLNEDWMMTHELVHTGFPSQNDSHHWMEEGSAVYIEPVARVQAGLLRADRIWSDMARDMPQGDPGAGDRGLDVTHTWGRTYWGGAQFCLIADVGIREQTHNRRGLQDALRAVVAAGGTIDQNWPIRRAFAVGDKATGTHVLENLYSRMATQPVDVDIQAIWNKLGVVRTPAGVRLDDSAPEAAIRRAITATPPWGRLAVSP